MKTWHEFGAESPELAAAGERLLYQGGDIASAYLATVAADGSPRVHPVFPVVADGQLWMFIVAMSPKYGDLCRDGRLALHSFPTGAGGEEFYIRGRAEQVLDGELKHRVVNATGGRQGNAEFEVLFRCDIERVLYTRWDNWGTEAAWPNYSKWRA